MSLTAGTPFEVNSSNIKDLIGLFVNLFANLLYYLAAYAEDLVGIGILMFVTTVFIGLLAGIGVILNMKWLSGRGV